MQASNFVNRKLAILFAIIAAVLASSYVTLFPLYSKPNLEEMRKHVISRLSDEALKNLYEASRIAYEMENTKAKLDEQKSLELRAEKQQKCASDIVYRERNPEDCTHHPIFPPRPIYRSVEDAFNRKLMGICLLVTTVKEAKRAGCLP